MFYFLLFTRGKYIGFNNVDCSAIYKIRWLMDKIEDFDLKGKKVLLRIDVNSPVVKGKILDSPRFDESSRTINFLIKRKAKVVILAHQGRKGDRDFLPLRQHAIILGKHIGKEIKYIDSLFDNRAIKAINSLRDGQAILLRNVRDYADESDVKSKDNSYISFCKNFDIFVNDAFSVSHRKQGSIIIPPRYLKSFMGIGMEKEISILKRFNVGRKINTIYLIGGAKIDDYLSLFNNLSNKRNKILASGVLANLFLVAKGCNLGYENEWLKEKGYIALASQLKEIYKKYKNQIILPVDFAIDNNGSREEIKLLDFPINQKILDVGHETVKLFKSELKNAKSIFMKGPAGFSEIPEFSYGTVSILKNISLLSKKKGVFSLLGGGHLTTSIKEYNINNNFSHISNSGGALIAYISGEKLPGLEALKIKNKY